MNTNVGMPNMNAMGGPVGGAPIPMMNNGAMHPQAAAAAAAANANRQPPSGDLQRTHLNTYIYEYFVRYEMYDCARALLNSNQQVNVQKDAAGGKMNGVGDDPMDTDSKDELDAKLPEDLPPPKLPMPASDTSFLYEWFCLFWDIYNAQRQKGGNGTVNQYVAHTQQQSRLRQNQQQDMLRQMRPDMTQQQYQAQMMRNMQNMNGMAMNMNKNNLARAAMANNQNNPQMQMLQQQAKQNQMQRDPSNMDNRGDRPSSPASGENAPSPSKRQRVDAPFHPNQTGAAMGNGRGQVMPGQPMPGNVAAAQAHQMLAMNGINPNSLNPQQLQNFVNSGPAAQQKSIATYSQNLQQHHGSQMGNKQGPNPAGPQNQGSPMMAQGPDGQTLTTYYNAGDMAAGGLRPGGPNQQPGSNHALQDYQMQLMLLEQQNKKRLMMARQEQDSMGVPRDGAPGPSPGAPGQPGPNGQAFPDTSPQGMRTGTSPNPSEQMKRGTPQMGNHGIPSPGAEGGQSRGSPNSGMNFMGNHVDPKMPPHFFGGVDGNNMAAAQAQMNGMRPPPGQPFNGQMTPQQMMARQQGQPQAGPNGQQWQQGPNGQMIPASMPQGQPQGQQAQGTPQQRSMPPPSAPAAAAAAANAANRTTASPQQAAAAPPTPNQTTKAAPKKKETKAAKEKRAANKKSNQNLNNANANATPSADNGGDTDAAAPATPITPVNPGFKGGAAGGGPPATGTAAPAIPAQAPVAPQNGADPNQNGGSIVDNYGNIVGVDLGNMEFTNPQLSGDVLNDFDFDSFLHDGDGGDPPFSFNDTFVDGSEIPAE